MEESVAAQARADADHSSGLDFTTPIRAFAATLQRHALPPERLGADPTYQPRAYLDTWLGRQRTGAPAEDVDPRVLE